MSSPGEIGVEAQPPLTSPFGSKLVGVIWLTACSAYASLWNYLPSFVKNSETVHIFKKSMRHYLTERKGYT